MRSYLLVICVLLVVNCGGPGDRGADRPQPFSFGVIADVQWGDKETGGNRHFRAALGKLEKCVAVLNQQDLAFTIQLGDFIDGQKSREKTLSDLDRVVEVFSKLTMPKYHVLGNHCLTAGREALSEKLELNRFYYDFTVPEGKGWRFIVLDGNDAGYGALGDVQLAWLDSTLTQARSKDEKVIVFNHFALLEAASGGARMKTPEPVLKLIEASGSVVVYFAGHHHSGGYAFEKSIHHITVKGMVDYPDSTAYAIIEVQPDRIRETGFGREPSRELIFGVPPSSEVETAVH